MRRSVALVLAPLAAACALAPPALAMQQDSALSPNLAELAKPSVQRLSDAAQARKLGVAVEGPGSLVREGNRVLVEVSFDHGAIGGLDALRAAGGRIVAASRRYQAVTVVAPPDALRGLAGVGGVGSVDEVRAPIVYGSGATTSAVGAECEGGSVISEGLDQLHVKDAWSKYGVNGAGVTVGVLSDSYDKATTDAHEIGPIATHASEDVESGDLPGPANGCASEKTPVNVIEDLPSSKDATDEGRAMLQIVHDVAPAAHLAFATAFNGETSFAKNIEKLKEAGAKVIVDDVGYTEEPFFQDGPIAAAVDKVASEGVSYFSAAGNDNLFDSSKNEIASWEAPEFRDTTCPVAVLAQLKKPSLGHCMDFRSSGIPDNTFGITVQAGKTLTVDLQWAEPRYGVHTDLDAYLLDSSGKLLEKEDQDNAGALKPEEGGTQKPVEVLQWENEGTSAREVQLAINRCFEECNPEADKTKKPRLKFALLENGRGVSETEYPVSTGEDVVGPTIFGHTAAAGAVSVAAIEYKSKTEPEPYSSRGPVKHFFGPVVNKTPAGAVNETIAKPDVTATDCGATTFFATFHPSEAAWRFCGTSAAAPHAAGVAALELDADPALEPKEIREAETKNAAPIGSFGTNAIGAGLVNADKAVLSLLPPSTVSVIGEPASRTKDATPSFEFEVNPLVPVECSIDGGARVKQCESPFESPPLKDGPHVFEVEVEGGGDSASFAFTVDTTAPTISFTKPGQFTSSASPAFAFTASEPAAFTCKVDGGEAKPCLSPYTPPAPLSDGLHTFSVTATDQVGNESQAQMTTTVDTVVPVVTITKRPPEFTSERSPTFEFTASEPSSLLCSFDVGSTFACGSPFVANELSDGHYTFEVLAIDKAGNVGMADAGFTVDTKRPRTSFGVHPPKVVRTRKRRVELAFGFHSSEAGSNFICKVDRNLFRFCQPRIVRRFRAGKHVVEVKAQDEAGNVDRTPAVYRFKVKRVR
jgi:hypothetical protein